MLNFERIKEIPIADVVLRYNVHLMAKGAWANSICPLPTHRQGDRGKNFSVNLAGNFWRCFSQACNEANGGKRGGDVINFVAVMESCSEKEAAQKLSEWFHVEYQPSKKEAAQHIAERRVTAPAGEAHPAKNSPEHTSSANEVKPSRYMQEIDLWFDTTFKRVDGEVDGVYWKRVRNAVKSKLIESFRSGKAHPTS